MSEAEEFARVVAARAQPQPRTSGNIFHWDDTGPPERMGGSSEKKGTVREHP